MTARLKKKEKKEKRLTPLAQANQRTIEVKAKCTFNVSTVSSLAKMDDRPRTSVLVKKIIIINPVPANTPGADSNMKGRFFVVTWRISRRWLKGENARIHPVKRRISFKSNQKLAGNSNSAADQREKYSLPIGREQSEAPTGPFKTQP